MLGACRYIDEVVVNTGDEDSKPAIIAAKATHIVNGSDRTRDRLMLQMGLTEDFHDEICLTIVLSPLVREFSTTELKGRVRQCK